jgi:hypothetical protein
MVCSVGGGYEAYIRKCDQFNSKINPLMVKITHVMSNKKM